MANMNKIPKTKEEEPILKKINEMLDEWKLDIPLKDIKKLSNWGEWASYWNSDMWKIYINTFLEEKGKIK